VVNYKKAWKLWLFPVATILASVFILNLYIDPLWCYPHSNAWNNHQPGFNERLQKTNRIRFTGIDQYDTLMLGSSRTAYIDQYNFKGMKVFNYAADNMLPHEYEKWIDIATRFKGSPFKNIIIGIDFFGTSKHYDEFIDRFYKGKKPEDYVRKSEEPLYRYKTLLTYDALKHSFESIKRTLQPTISDYDRKNVRHCNVIVPPETKKRYIERDIAEYREYMTVRYEYREEWPKILKRMINKYPKTRFIFFTTPVSKPFFDTFVLKADHIEDYARWLSETVEATGELYHFMDLNSVTIDLNNFFDAHHLYAKGVRYIAWRITDPANPNLPGDFGKKLNQKNLSEYLIHFRDECKSFSAKIPKIPDKEPTE
jgi:hypothetical protein